MADRTDFFIGQGALIVGPRRAVSERPPLPEENPTSEARVARRREVRHRVSLSLRGLADRIEPAPACDGCVPGVGAA